MDKTLWTIGYGNDKPEHFLKRLAGAGITTVLDVRREGSKSWCSSYKQGWAAGMGVLIRDAGMLYGTWQALGNSFDVLDAYEDWLAEKLQVGKVHDLKRLIEERSSRVFCLLCCERDAHKNGKVNCHRAYVADALLKLLGDDWRLVHL